MDIPDDLIPDELKSSSALPYWGSPLPEKRERKPTAKLDQSLTSTPRRQKKKNIVRQNISPTPGLLPDTGLTISPNQVSKFALGSPSMATQRNRAARGGPRGNGQDTGEEIALWTTSQEEIKKVCRSLARAEQVREEIVAKEIAFKAMEPAKPSVQEIDALSALYREEVKLTEEFQSVVSGGDNSILQKLSVLKAVTAHNEGSAAELPRRGVASRDGAARERSAATDFDGAADSPAPSPIVDKPLRKDRTSGRSSLPPKEIPIKQENAEASVTSSGPETNTKGKITFAMGAEVAFRPKATGAEEPEWIQGVVVKIIGEGKSRRYDVQDPEPDEITKKPGQVYRTSASSMVTIPPLGQPLADYPKGKHVLARYPDTTTFYRAEVVGMNGSKVNLKFEGEEDAQVTMEVDRRFVLDHRG